MSEDEFMFLINTAEHIERPVDMLMLLGEYFKVVIMETGLIHSNIQNKKTSYAQKQDKFYITPELMNSLGIACKKYIEAPR